MNNNYYQDIIGKINHFISKEDWQEALNLVTEELNVAYIPQIYEQQFYDLRDEIILNLKKIDQAANNLSSQIWSLETITKTISDLTQSENHLVAFYYLQKHNVRLILPIIKDYLVKNQNSNFNKTQLLYILKEQGIDEELLCVKFNKTFKINPSKLVFWKEIDTYQLVNKELQTKVEIDNPGLYKICIYLLNNYFQVLTPEFPQIKQKSAIAAAIYIRACSLQFIKISLLLASKMFNSTQNSIKVKLLDIQKNEIN